MKRRFQTTAAAFLVLLVLLVYANYYEVEEILQPGAHKPAAIIGFDANKIDAVAWVEGEKETMRIEKKDGVFRLTLPGNYEIEGAEAEGITRHFAELKSELIAAETDSGAEDFGFNETSPRVRLTSGSETVELILGSKSPVGGSHYLARVGVAKVFMVPGYIRGDFYKTAQNLRRRDLFVEKFGVVNRIEIDRAGEKIVVQKADALEWKIVEPVKLPADAGVIAGLIDKLQNLRISRFCEDNPEKPQEWGFSPPQFRIVVQSDSGHNFALETGETAGTETYFRRDGSSAIHAILNSDVRDLNLGVNDIRSRTLADLEMARLQKLVLKDSAGELVLARVDKKWKLGERIVDAGAVQDFIDMYEQSRVSQFLMVDKAGENGLAEPENCPGFSFVYEKETQNFIFGTVQGVNLSLLHQNEILLVKLDLKRAFAKLVKNIREPVETVVTGGEDRETPELE